jgi:predicted helicase
MINKTYRHFSFCDRGTIESACGSGKTLTTYWINNKLMNNLTIIAVPSLFLLSQFYKDWTKQLQLENKQADFILVGSDADCGDVKFQNNGLIITTNTQEITMNIKQIIKRNTINNISFHKLIIITTYQSSDKLISALNQLKIKPDLCIFDEAHKTVGQTGTQFSLLLDDANIEIRKRLFVTATPKIYNGNADDDNMLSMDDKKWYGKKIYTYNTSNAIKDGFLVNYQIVTIYTDDVYVDNMIKQNKYVWYNSKMFDSQLMATGIMILNQFKKQDCNHLVTYHNSVIGSRKFKDLLEKLNESYKLNIKILDVNGDHSMKQRNRIFKEFTDSKLSILVSARVLNEGVNIPIIDSVCFVNPRNSTIDIIQCIGRSLRLYDGKKMAKIYVPVIIDDITKVDENKVFGNLIRILKCLSETDDGINDYFNGTKNGKICDRKLIRHDNCLSVEKAGDIINVNDWMNNIDIKLWHKVDSWEYNYNELVKWVNENQKIPIQQSNNEL